MLTRQTCYGEFREDERSTYGKVLGAFANPGPDERDLIGARTIVPFNGGGDWTCAKPDHWLFEGTGMKKGDSIPGLVGWESMANPMWIDQGWKWWPRGTSGPVAPAWASMPPRSLPRAKE